MARHLLRISGISSRRMSGSVLFCLVFLFLLPLSVASQDEGLPGDEEEPAHVEAPPREWATLDVVAIPPADIAADLGQKTSLSVTVTNNGNIPATGVVVRLEGTWAFATPEVKVGDLKPETTVTLELPVDLYGRFADPHPFFVRATADNIATPTVVGS